MIFNPNQSFGNRIANIAFAQGSQNLQWYIIIIMVARSQIGNIDQEFFSLFNLLCKTVRFEAFLGPVRVSPRKACKNSCASHDFQSKPEFWQQDC